MKLQLIALVLLYLFVMHNNTRYFTTACKSLVTRKSVTISNNILLEIQTYLTQNVPDLQDRVFVDLGCGTGEALVYLHECFKKCVGVELDKDRYQQAVSSTKDCSNTAVVNQDMQDYRFTNEPSVIYLYEPLWPVLRKDAEKMYSKVFDGVCDTDNVIVVYVSGICRKDLSREFFSNRGFTLLHKKGLDRC